ncbi:phosphatase PAP2 family protein [Ginsengibacter hankyongi]|uniref:Phosphatase PAP2 family protein n=1 Tax=Ginsengibacter hankyongi TaxID=2607284 RepID=A0A5J5IJI2_9BACT|nr:phosphatase PAP2 family protein [Ginsengibacter hankyongi]KAA9038525.1 phosphatase PAP2 family protein [Ginsengibacter hankyongi]
MQLMNGFDSSIIGYLNKFAQTSKSFDAFMVFIVDNSFIKAVILVCILWFFWFQKSSKLTGNRKGVIVTIFSCLVAIAVGRLLCVLLPFRARPIINPAINFVKPFGTSALSLGTWSSFPSDNAVMFFSLATGIFLISRKLGILTYLYVLFVICFPRVYLGYHFPTDILAGAVIGILITFLISGNKISNPLSNKVFEFSAKHTGIFYSLAFLLTYEISKMFIEVRFICSHLLEVMRRIV